MLKNRGISQRINILETKLVHPVRQALGGDNKIHLTSLHLDINFIAENKLLHTSSLWYASSVFLFFFFLWTVRLRRLYTILLKCLLHICLKQ